MRRKNWNIKPRDPQVSGLSAELKLSPLLLQVLLNRGIAIDQINSFLNPSMDDLHSPLLLPDMEKAVARLRLAARNKERIFVYGDYDVDGITSLAIFNEFLKTYPGQYSFSIPHRVDDGYGLNCEAVRKAKEEGASLIVAFDCGTGSREELDLALSLGLDVIIVDHHHSRDTMAGALAFINPKRSDSRYPFADLSSGALSFKLLQALTGDDCRSVLDLVALSIVCDVVPIKGENRILLRAGMEELRRTTRPAIVALCRIGRIKQDRMDTFHLGFVLGPRLNAAGRISKAGEALEMFLTESQAAADAIAAKLDGYNLQRRGVEAAILKQAQEKVGEFAPAGAIVVCQDGWHPGVLGIVASRLADKHYRPAFVISFDGDVGKGSARSIHSVHLMDMLAHCGDCLQGYGGHRRAAGIEIHRKDVDIFKKRVDDFLSKNLQPHDLVPIIEVEVQTSFAEIDLWTAYELEKLEPFGEENPKPLFTVSGLRKKAEPAKIPAGYSLWLSDSCGRTHESVIYDKDLVEIAEYGQIFDAVFSLEVNTYHNIPRLVIKDLRIAQS